MNVIIQKNPGMCIYGIYVKYVWNIYGILKLKLELTLLIISKHDIFVITRLTQIECYASLICRCVYFL